MLHELGLSPHRSQVVAVKLEVDTNPPRGAGLSTSVVTRHVVLQLQHHDRASLLAGKIHALLQRPYLKGRDIFDLWWYLSNPTWPAPNLVLLNNALQQTGWPGESMTQTNWKAAIHQRVEPVVWDHVMLDVEPFLEQDPVAIGFTKDRLRQVIN
ncbi:MAG: nucleotidyl transferase AbiEii/AbiGii toxin family protein [Caldilineaceae bacterium]|nr:nucleotidyl transferase AbiEii/AbiGii toxin family protein [Caldilineaceae bacterium]